MQRTLLGAVAGMLLLGGGIAIWQGIAQTPEVEEAALPPPPEPGDPLTLPESPKGLIGRPPPELPKAREQSREERRFARYDGDRSGIITRVEMLSTRTAAFRRLDRDGNNLLSFEEWAVATSERFASADRDRSGGLTSSEFATTAPPPRADRSTCRC